MVPNYVEPDRISLTKAVVLLTIKTWYLYQLLATMTNTPENQLMKREDLGGGSQFCDDLLYP